MYSSFKRKLFSYFMLTVSLFYFQLPVEEEYDLSDIELDDDLKDEL